MKIKYLLLILFTTLLFSCKKTIEDVSPYTFDVSTLQTQDAKLLFIIKDHTQLGTSTNRLVKIKADDTVQEINLTDVNGTGVADKLRPLCLSNANPDFMLISMARGGDSPVDGYLINKSTGALISIAGFGGAPAFIEFGTLMNNRLSYFDGSSFLYFKTTSLPNSGSIVRVSTVNPNYITGQKMLPDTVYRVESFAVDADKNIIVNMIGQSLGQSKFVVFNSNNTTFMPDIYGATTYWVGATGKFNYNGLGGYLKQVTYNDVSNTFTFSDYKNLFQNGINTQLFNHKSYKVIYSGKFILVNDGKVYELENGTNPPKVISTINIANQQSVSHSQTNGLVFIAGENASGQQTIFRINLASNYSYTTYPTPGKYNFSEIEAFEDGTVYATAKRNSDGKYVILKFAPDGTETLLDETLNKKGIWLEKVSEFTN